VTLIKKCLTPLERFDFKISSDVNAVRWMQEFSSRQRYQSPVFFQYLFCDAWSISSEYFKDFLRRALGHPVH